MAFSFHKHIQMFMIRKLNALLAVLAVTHIISGSKREEGALLAVELPVHGSPVFNLKMCQRYFQSGSGMAWKKSQFSLDFTGRTGKPLVGI